MTVILLLVEETNIVCVQVSPKYYELAAKCHNKSLQEPESQEVDELFHLLGGGIGDPMTEINSEFGEIVEHDELPLDLIGLKLYWFFYN